LAVAYACLEKDATTQATGIMPGTLHGIYMTWLHNYLKICGQHFLEANMYAIIIVGCGILFSLTNSGNKHTSGMENPKADSLEDSVF